MKFSIIVATDVNGGIGLYEEDDFSIPWNNKRDIIFFKDMTSSTTSKKVVIIFSKSPSLVKSIS